MSRIVMMRLNYIVSAYDHQRFPYVDYDYKASANAKRKLYKAMRDAGVLWYFKGKRPGIIKDMEKII